MNCSRDMKWDRLSHFVQEQMNLHNIPGVSIGIFYNGEVQSDGFGVTSVENPLPVTTGTLFQIGSITKTFTCTAIMRLVEMGKIELDAPVRTYYPEFKVADEETSSTVTIRHLLTHTAGWVGDFFIDTGIGESAIAKYAYRMADLEQISPVGEFFSYNNAGFFLLGYIIELVTEKTYEQVIHELVIDPLELENCYFNPSDVMVNRFAVGHIDSDGEVKVAKPWAISRAGYPAGGLVCNVDELVKYAVFHLQSGQAHNGEIVSESEVMHTMQTPQVFIWGDKEAIGLTWFVDDVCGTKIVSHSGGTFGQSSYLLFAPRCEFVIAILTNAGSGGHLNQATREWCLREYLGLHIKEPVALKTTMDKMRECVGRYILPRFGYVDISITEERLVAQIVLAQGSTAEDTPPASVPPYTLHFLGKDRLGVLDGEFKNWKVDLIRDSNGNIKWIRQNGQLYFKEAMK